MDSFAQHHNFLTSSHQSVDATITYLESQVLDECDEELDDTAAWIETTKSTKKKDEKKMTLEEHPVHPPPVL